MQESIKKNLAIFAFILVIALGISALSTTHAFAASVQSLNFYTGIIVKADINNDKKMETIQTTEERTVDKLAVNNKVIKQWDRSSYEHADVRLITLKNKKAFLEICVQNVSTRRNSCGLYQLNKKNQLVCVQDYLNLFNKKQLMKNSFLSDTFHFSYAYTTKVSDNTLDLQTSLATKSLGQLSSFSVKLAYSKGKFVVKPSPSDVSYIVMDFNGSGYHEAFTAKAKINTVKTAGSNKKAKTISKGANFKVSKVAIVGKNVYVCATPDSGSGKFGWFKLGTGKSLVKYGSVLLRG